MAKQVFLSYSHKDETLREELTAHLEILQANGTLTTWHARRIQPGDELRSVVDREMAAADIVLLLVSADFLASAYGRDTEVRQAIERHAQGVARVVPVVLRPCLWEEAAFGHLAPLPASGLPITRWPDRDEAWLEIARGVRELVRGAPSEEDRAAGSPPLTDSPAKTTVPDAPKGRGRASASAVSRPEVERWLRELEGAQVEKEAVAARGGDVASIQATITELKRHLREGGQLQQNDSLGDGRYFLLRLLGRGGFATVWEADDRTSGKRVAIKVLHPQLASDPTRRERFSRGARAMAKLDHPNVARVLVPYEEDAGFLYFVMDLFPRGDLHRAVLDGTFERTRAVPLILAVGDALAEAHAQGFVHRDVSPQNILLAADGSPRLSDFDLVAAADTTGGTRTGPMGKYLYAAPEAMSRPQDADARADVFGLGMTAIFCLYGKDLPTNVLRRPEQILAELDCGPLAEVLARAIEWEPEQRYPSARAFCDALRAVTPREAPPPGVESHPLATFQRSRVEAVSSPATPEMSDTEPPVTPLGSEDEEPPLAPAGRWSGKRAGWAGVALLMLLGAGTATAKLWPVGAKGGPSGETSASAPSRCPPGMAFLPAGTFRMGSEATDKEAEDDQRPAHDVTLSAFCLDVTEVTVAQYRQCVKEERNGVQCSPAPTTVSWADPSSPEGKFWSGFCNADRSERDEHPINCADWKMADSFCRWHGGSLPTEAQWEYAATGGKERRKFPWGAEEPGPALLNACGSECRALGGKGGKTWPAMYEGDDGAAATAPVGRYPKGATPEGLVDLAGNVFEWVQDTKVAYDPALSKDPVQTEGRRRVLRGGGWYDGDPRWVRAAYRHGEGVDSRDCYVGFRCARGPNP